MLNAELIERNQVTVNPAFKVYLGTTYQLVVVLGSLLVINSDVKTPVLWKNSIKFDNRKELWVQVSLNCLISAFILADNPCNWVILTFSNLEDRVWVRAAESIHSGQHRLNVDHVIHGS